LRDELKVRSVRKKEEEEEEEEEEGRALFRSHDYNQAGDLGFDS
jgi:hypothetical protein